TVARWRRDPCSTPDARFACDLPLEGVYGCECKGVSLRDVLALIVSVGGNLQTATDDAQELRFRGGAAGIAHRLAASLNLPIVLRAPVRAVKQDGHGVRIQTTR